MLFSHTHICFYHDWYQAALNKDNSSKQNDSNDFRETLESTSSKMNGLYLSENAVVVTPTNSTVEDRIQVIDKKIRTLKRKVKFIFY